MESLIQTLRAHLMCLGVFQCGFFADGKNQDGYYLATDGTTLDYSDRLGDYFYLRIAGQSVTEQVLTSSCRPSHYINVPFVLFVHLQSGKFNRLNFADSVAAHLLKLGSYEVDVVPSLQILTDTAECFANEVEGELTYKGQIFSISGNVKGLFGLNCCIRNC